MHICAVPLDILLIEEDYEVLLSHMPDETKEKIKRFHFKEDSCRTLFGRLLLKYILESYYGIKDYQIIFNQYGRPYLEEYDNIHFSISHSGGWIICAVNEDGIGIDIETVKPFKSKEKLLSLAKVFMREEELQVLLNVEGEELTLLFYDFWTGKEAVVKYLGKGIGDVKKYCLRFNGKSKALVEGYETELFIRKLVIDEGYKVSICTDAEVGKQEIEIISVGELVDFMKTH